MRILQKLEKSKNFWFLLIASFSFFILRFPSLFEPDWYGDEGVYQAVSIALRNGRLLYQDIWDNKPPLLYLVYGFFGTDQFWIKFASLVFGLSAIVVFFYLSRKLFRNFNACIISTSFFAILFGLPMLEGNIANAENFMLFPILLSALFLTNIHEPVKTITEKAKERNIKIIFAAGLLLGIAFLFKIVAIFDFAAFLLFLFFIDSNLINHLKKKNYQSYEVKKLFSYVGGFLLLPTLTALFFFLKGAFIPFINATLFSNIGYVGYGNQFLIPQGLLILKLILLVFISYFIFLKRGRLGTGAVFALLWISFSLFNTFFSQRPYTHYILVLLPSFAILLGLILEGGRLRKFFLSLFLTVLFLLATNFSFYSKSLPYYGNFLSFVTEGKSVRDYQRFFDRTTPVDYELASFIKVNTNKKDYIFTWGNNAQLYKLSDKLPPGKYTVAYHVTSSKNGLKETAKDLNTKKPKLIIIMPYMKYFPFELTGYVQRVMIDQALVYERVL